MKLGIKLLFVPNLFGFVYAYLAQNNFFFVNIKPYVPIFTTIYP